VLQALLKDLLATFEQNRAVYFEMNRDASAKIVELVYKLQAVVQEAITRTTAMKQAIRKGRYPSSQAGLMARNAEAVQEIQDMILRVQAHVSTLQGKKQAQAKTQQEPFFLREYRYTHVLESMQFLKDKRKYGAYADTIEEVKRRVLEAPEFVPTLHKQERRAGSLQYSFHARISLQLRIIYWLRASPDNKVRTVVWDKIINKNEYDHLIEGGRNQ
jgi:hypothetical protein